jgi:hypothetical protein
MNTYESQSGSLAQSPDQALPSMDQTLQQMADFIRKFLVCSEQQRTILVLWIVHTYCFDHFPLTPYIEIFSPENQSGKSVCLRLLKLLCNKPWLPAGLNPTRLINRTINYQPTLLLDNWNTVLRASESHSMIGFLNAGSVDESYYPVNPDDHYSDRLIFCPKAFAGAGRLPASLADRCIPIVLRRNKPKEQVLPLWSDYASNARRLVQPLPDWTSDHRAQFRQIAYAFLCSPRPALPRRHKELIAPLLAIAGMAGGRWPLKARSALLRIFASSPKQPPSVGLQLLSDIRGFFALHHDPLRIHTAPLLEYLNALPERPWKKLTPNGLRGILQNFPIGRSANQRIDGHNFKGFTFRHFVDSWESYLPLLSSRRSTPQPPTADQVVTNGVQVVTNGSQVVTNAPQVVTPAPQVVTNGGQVVTNSQSEAANPNVFNTAAAKINQCQ